MSDLGTVSILVDVRGQPVVKELATDLNNVAAAETKVSAATQKVMEDFRRTREIMANVKRATDDTSASFQRFSAKELQQASQRMNGFESALANTRRGMGQMGMATQQIGYQVGDFLVQVQSGTNWMVAFGQQATQLVGILPSFAGSLGMSVGSVIALSSGLGIAIPLVTALGAYFMRTSEEVNQGTSALENYKQVVGSLSGSLEETTLKLEALRRGVAPDKFLEAKLAIDALNSEFLKLTTTEGVANDDPWGLSNRLREITETRAALQKTLDALQNAAAEQQRVETAAKRRANEQRDAYREAKAEADRWKASLEGIKSVLDSMNGMAVSVTLDLQSTASGWASEFLGKLTTGLENKAEYVKAVGGGRGLGMGGPELDPYGFRKQLDRVPAGKSGSSGSKRSGGGGGSLAENRMEDIYRYLESDKYLVEQENLVYQQRQETLESSLKNKIITLEEYNQIEKDLKTKHEYELASIEQNARSQRLDDAAGFFGSLASVAEAGGGKMVKAASIFSAAQGLINSYTAYTEMLKDPAFIGRPWARFGAAASVLASGLRMVQAIKGVGSGGSGAVSGGGSVGSATVASSASAPAPQTVFIDSLDPDGLYSGQALINLFDAFYDENDKRGKVFMVAR